jgi:hypothetical protein
MGHIQPEFFDFDNRKLTPLRKNKNKHTYSNKNRHFPKVGKGTDSFSDHRNIFPHWSPQQVRTSITSRLQQVRTVQPEDCNRCVQERRLQQVRTGVKNKKSQLFAEEGDPSGCRGYESKLNSEPQKGDFLMSIHHHPSAIRNTRKRGLRILPASGGYFVHVTSRVVQQMFSGGILLMLREIRARPRQASTPGAVRTA